MAQFARYFHKKEQALPRRACEYHSSSAEDEVFSASTNPAPDRKNRSIRQLAQRKEHGRQQQKHSVPLGYLAVMVRSVVYRKRRQPEINAE